MPDDAVVPPRRSAGTTELPLPRLQTCAALVSMHPCSEAFQRCGVQVCALSTQIGSDHLLNAQERRAEYIIFCIHTNDRARAGATKLRNHVHNRPCGGPFRIVSPEDANTYGTQRLIQSYQWCPSSTAARKRAPCENVDCSRVCSTVSDLLKAEHAMADKTRCA